MAMLAYQYPVFQKAMRIITSITNASPAIVTTSFAHQYITGMIVRLNIPNGYGMQQANQMYAPIVVLTTTTFSIAIDTIKMDPFVYQVNLGNTDGSGAASGTISGTSTLIGLGQIFNIGSQRFTVVATSGALSTTGSGSGTMNLATGAYTFTGCSLTTAIFWTPISFPESYQYACVTPIGETNGILTAATQNVLPYSAT